MKNLSAFKLIVTAISFLIIQNLGLKSQIVHQVLNHTITGISEFNLNLDGNASVDYKFTITELSPGVLICRVTPNDGSMVLDNSGFGYPDALNLNSQILFNFTVNNGILGTFTPAGNFNGKGEKFLGIKLRSGISEFIGWIKLDLSTDNDTLKIISFAYLTNNSLTILAGQTEITYIANYELNNQISIYPNPSSEYIYFKNGNNEYFNYQVFNNKGQVVLNGKTNYKINISTLNAGSYFIKYWNTTTRKTEKLLIVKN